MNEVKNDVKPQGKRSNEPIYHSMYSKMDEMVTILRGIDDKLVSILRAVQEINKRG